MHPYFWNLGLIPATVDSTLTYQSLTGLPNSHSCMISDLSMIGLWISVRSGS